MVIDRFRGRYAFLSSFWACRIPYKGLMYTSLEAAYQAQKDPEKSKDFVSLSSTESKVLGRTLKNIQKDWDESKVNVMRQLLYIKFTHPDLREKLVQTGVEELIEGNTWHDLFWGKCLCKKHNDQGENVLGNLLMEVRTNIRK